eukprot:1863565-Amphidinium_carterae.1
MQQQHQDPRNHQSKQHHSTRSNIHNIGQQYVNYFGSVNCEQHIAYAIKELSRSLQCPDEEDQRNMRQLLRYI